MTIIEFDIFGKFNVFLDLTFVYLVNLTFVYCFNIIELSIFFYEIKSNQINYIKMTEKTIQPDYIYQENFLDNDLAKTLIGYFDNHVGDTPNVNPRFNNRVIYYESIKDPKIKAHMKSIQDQVCQKLSKFYGLKIELYPEATHIVKWPTGSQLGNHADNAYENGTPNYVNWRTHSAVAYLNSDFEGGDFCFKKNPNQPIHPKTGLLVGFTAGMDHVHHVKKITQGVRYAMPMWFSTDRGYPEYSSSSSSSTH